MKSGGDAQVNQIKDLMDKGHTVEEVCIMLQYDKDTVSTVFDALKQAMKLGLIHSTNATPPAGQNDNSNNIDIYQANKHRIRQRLVNLAMSAENESASVKAAIYINEELTGRNDKRVEKQNAGVFLDLGKALLSIQKAKDRVAEALDRGSIINV